MQTRTLSRESMLAAIRQNLPQRRVSRPGIPAFPGPDRPLRAMFEEHLTKAGGAAHPVGAQRRPRPH